MGGDTLSTPGFKRIRDQATGGGTTRATHGAEQRINSGLGLDPLVDPKGLPQYGPVRLSKPRFSMVDGVWQLTRGLPMAIETLLDTTGSMGGNVELAFNSLPLLYAMLTEGDNPLLGRYDPQIATAIFNDVQDRNTAVLARSQYEMAEKIPEQMAMLPPGHGGGGNGKEDPQYGLFAAAHLTAPTILQWGLLPYHFTVSDEPVAPTIESSWLKHLFGDDVFDRVRENGFDLEAGDHQVSAAIATLQTRAHAFFLQVPYGSWGGSGETNRVYAQWSELYGADHVVTLRSTEYLHYVEAIIIGLTEGVLDLESAVVFLREHGLDEEVAFELVESVAHIDLGAQARRDGFDAIPLAGALFGEKTDITPLTDEEAAAAMSAAASSGNAAGPNWV